MWKEKTTGWVHDNNNIKGFFEEYRYLSNFHLCPVMFDGVIYPSSENAYMAAKTLDLKLRKRFEIIAPNKAKKLGQEIEVRDDWENIKLEIMDRILTDKFYRNLEEREKLLSTENKYLEETNWWGDRFWGVCKGTGANNLGLILMKIRDNYFYSTIIC